MRLQKCLPKQEKRKENEILDEEAWRLEGGAPLRSSQGNKESDPTAALGDGRETNHTSYEQLTAETQFRARTCVSEANSHNTDRVVGDHANKVCP